MKQFPRVLATVVKITNRGKCIFGHQVGDKFVFTEMGCDKPMCIYAQQALIPAIEIILHGGKFPWKKRKGALYWGCSHPGNLYQGRGQVIFKLEVK